MTGKKCARLWQVEAARDGRLTGSDLSNALRHRAECAECGQAAHALSELGRQIQRLPAPSTDLLVLRRTRQTLLGAWNELLLAETEPKPMRRAALIAAFCTASGVALAVGYPLAHRVSRSSERSVSQGRVLVRLNAQPSFELKAGQSWQPEPASLPVAAPPPLAVQLAIAKPSPPSAAKGRVAQTLAKPASAQPPPDTAEDDAYLHIVDLLRNGHELEARAKASQFLLQFPNGFRRLEVANIARVKIE